jgi:hypothetical protein
MGALKKRISLASSGNRTTVPLSSSLWPSHHNARKKCKNVVKLDYKTSKTTKSIQTKIPNINT